MAFYKMKIIKTALLNVNNLHEQYSVIIVQNNLQYPWLWMPSPLTHFIMYKHRGSSSINSKKKTALTLCSFMNYLKLQVQDGSDIVFDNLKQDGLFRLNFYHLAKYLNYISLIGKKTKNSDSFKLLRYETVKEKENILLQFYEFLNFLGITSDNAKIERTILAFNNNSYGEKSQQISRIISPFDNNPNYFIDYPPSNRQISNILKDMDIEVWSAFIEYASTYYPQIALGIAFQIMGGLRLGEIVNLVPETVRLYKNKNHIKLDIKDRQNILFSSRNIQLTYSQVKVPRENQPIFNFDGTLFKLWDKHLSYLSANKKKDCQALFVDYYGNEMTGEVYQRNFHKLKYDFLEYVGKNNPHLKETLLSYSWGTHIGRHIYTNHLIKTGYINNSYTGRPDPKLLMILRGDKSDKSAEAYLDIIAITNVVATKINQISKFAIITEKGDYN